MVGIKWWFQRHGLSSLCKYYQTIACPSPESWEYSDSSYWLSFLLGVENGGYESLVNDEVGVPEHQSHQIRKGEGIIALWNEENEIIIYQSIFVPAWRISWVLMWYIGCPWSPPICQFPVKTEQNSQEMFTRPNAGHLFKYDQIVQHISEPRSFNDKQSLFRIKCSLPNHDSSEMPVTRLVKVQSASFIFAEKPSINQNPDNCQQQKLSNKLIKKAQTQILDQFQHPWLSLKWGDIILYPPINFEQTLQKLY